MFLTNNASIQEVLFFPQMRPEKKQVELSEDAKSIFKIIKDYKKVELEWLKEQVGFSNKKWDKAIKELTTQALASVNKYPDGKLEVWLE
jgi:lysyl-tRNA synthetase class 2